MKKNFVIVIGLVAVLIMGNVVNAATMTKVAENHSWGCQRPMATGLYDEVADKTFIVWNGPEMDIYVRTYDHSTSTWGGEAKIADLDMIGKWDYHNYPAMILAPNGKLQVYYNRHSKKAFMLEAPNTHSIDGQWSFKEISNDLNCYPMPVVADDDIYFFYSKNNQVSYPYRTFRYIKSTDNGVTWSNPVTVIDSGKNDSNKFDEVYAKQVKYDAVNNRLYMTWQMAGGEYGHNKQSKDLHMAYLNLNNNKMYGIGDIGCGNIVNYSDFANTIVFDSEPGTPNMGYGPAHNLNGGVFSWIGNKPVISIGYDDVMGDDSSKTYFYKWTGTQWNVSTISSISSKVLDMDRLGNYWDDFRFLIASSTVENGIDVFKTNNGGGSFALDDSFILPLDNGATRANYITFIDDASPSSDVEVIWAECGPTDPNNYTRGIWSVYTSTID
jgi:hypothetical protein